MRRRHLPAATLQTIRIAADEKREHDNRDLQGARVGFSFRKSKKLGPFRVTLSKSGISASVGVKGARITSGPRGTHLTAGAGGVTYRTRLDQKQASSPTLAAASAPPNYQVPNQDTRHHWSIGKGCLAIGCGLPVLLVLIGSLLPAVPVRDMGSHPGPNRWRPFTATGVRTVDFKSPYPWIQVTRRADGMRGYLVYAPVDQVPADWPSPMRMVSQHMLGFWQFVRADGSVEGDREGVREFNSCTVWDSCMSGGGDPLTLGWAFSAFGPDPSAFIPTPAGQQTINSLR